MRNILLYMHAKFQVPNFNTFGDMSNFLNCKMKKKIKVSPYILYGFELIELDVELNLDV